MHRVDGPISRDIQALYRVSHIKGRQNYLAPDILSAQGFEPFN